MLTGTIIVIHSEKEAFVVKNTGNIQENIEELSEVAPLEGTFYLINGQFTTRGEGVKVVVCKSVTKSSAKIFYIVIKTTFKKYFFTTLIST